MSDGIKRPGGWVDGIGWVALRGDLPQGTIHKRSSGAEEWVWFGPLRHLANTPVIVTRWADGTTPEAGS